MVMLNRYGLKYWFVRDSASYIGCYGLANQFLFLWFCLFFYSFEMGQLVKQVFTYELAYFIVLLWFGLERSFYFYGMVCYIALLLA